MNWGGNCYDVSNFFKLGKIREEQRIDDFLDVDIKRGIYVALGYGNEKHSLPHFLELGSLFKKNAPKEIFELPSIGCMYRAWLLNVEIQGHEVVVCFTDPYKKENAARLVFYPKMLK